MLLCPVNVKRVIILHLSHPNVMGMTGKPTRYSSMFCIANDWSEDQCKKYLASSLTGDTVYVLAGKDIRSWTNSDLCRAIEEKYGVSNSQYVNRNRLCRVTQRSGQTIQQLADGITKLARHSFSSVQEEENLAVDDFIDAINDAITITIYVNISWKSSLEIFDKP